ncbi:MAG: hypothetical protein PVG53_12790 [Holophagae bacterium]|jgi:hypothetical protein
MNTVSLQHVLIMDWCAIENTPADRRRPLVMQRWHFRAERLAGLLDRPTSEVVAELQESARQEARRQQRDMEFALAEDLAVCRAQGRAVTPPWERKLRTLAEISGRPFDEVGQRVERAAAAIQVVEVG